MIEKHFVTHGILEKLRIYLIKLVSYRDHFFSHFLSPVFISFSIHHQIPRLGKRNHHSSVV